MDNLLIVFALYPSRKNRHTVICCQNNKTPTTPVMRQTLTPFHITSYVALEGCYNGQAESRYLIWVKEWLIASLNCFNKISKSKWITPYLTICSNACQIGKSWGHRHLRNHCLSKNAAIFSFSFLQAAFGSDEAATAELTAIVLAPARKTASMLFSFMPPIAT